MYEITKYREPTEINGLVSLAVSVFWCLKRVHVKERKRGDKKAGALHSTMVDRRLENAIWSQPKQPFMSFIVIVYLKCQMTNKSCYNFSMIETQKFVWVNPSYEVGYVSCKVYHLSLS